MIHRISRGGVPLASLSRPLGERLLSPTPSPAKGHGCSVRPAPASVRPGRHYCIDERSDPEKCTARPRATRTFTLVRGLASGHAAYNAPRRISRAMAQTGANDFCRCAHSRPKETRTTSPPSCGDSDLEEPESTASLPPDTPDYHERRGAPSPRVLRACGSDGDTMHACTRRGAASPRPTRDRDPRPKGRREHAAGAVLLPQPARDLVYRPLRRGETCPDLLALRRVGRTPCSERNKMGRRLCSALGRRCACPRGLRAPALAESPATASRHASPKSTGGTIVSPRAALRHLDAGGGQVDTTGPPSPRHPVQRPPQLLTGERIRSSRHAALPSVTAAGAKAPRRDTVRPPRVVHTLLPATRLEDRQPLPCHRGECASQHSPWARRPPRMRLTLPLPRVPSAPPIGSVHAGGALGAVSSDRARP